MMNKVGILVIVLLAASCTQYRDNEYVVLKEENKFIPVCFILGMLDDSQWRLQGHYDGQWNSNYIERFYPNELHEVDLFEYYLRIVIRDISLIDDLEVEVGPEDHILFKSYVLADYIYSHYRSIDFDNYCFADSLFNNENEQLSYLAGVYSRYYRQDSYYIPEIQFVKLSTVEKLLKKLGCENVIRHNNEPAKTTDDLIVGMADERIEFDCRPEVKEILKNYDIDIQK